MDLSIFNLRQSLTGKSVTAIYNGIPRETLLKAFESGDWSITASSFKLGDHTIPISYNNHFNSRSESTLKHAIENRKELKVGTSPPLTIPKRIREVEDEVKGLKKKKDTPFEYTSKDLNLYADSLKNREKKMDIRRGKKIWREEMEKKYPRESREPSVNKKKCPCDHRKSGSSSRECMPAIWVEERKREDVFSFKSYPYEYNDECNCPPNDEICPCWFGGHIRFKVLRCKPTSVCLCKDRK
jgi:hypothetical protein